MSNSVILPSLSDDRISQREGINGIARVSYGKAFTIGCAILDVSYGGARLGYRDPVIVPDIVTVMFPAGNVMSCRVCWRTATAFGVEFVK
jgi:hypothetical protein